MLVQLGSLTRYLRPFLPYFLHFFPLHFGEEILLGLLEQIDGVVVGSLHYFEVDGSLYNAQLDLNFMVFLAQSKRLIVALLCC